MSTPRYRGHTQRELQQVRDRLMSQTGVTPAYDYELLFFFARNQLSTGQAVMMYAATVAAICMLWVHWIWPVAWLSGVLATQAWNQRCARKLLAEESDSVDLAGWTRLFTVTEFFSASIWSTLCLISQTADGLGIEVFVFSALIIIVCVRTIQASPILSAVFAATLPITAMLSVIFVSSQHVEPIAMAGIAISAQIFFTMISRRINETTLTMLHYRAEKDILISKLEEEKSKSDEGRRRAEDANVAKSRFLATMSHELRTPLNAILGFSEIMKDEIYGAHTTPRYGEYAADIHRSGRHLLELINEILDLSRIEAGRYEITEEALDLVSTVEDCCYLMSLRASAKGIDLVGDYRPGMPRIWADARAVRQICLNLLSNAVKFTPANGEVTVRCGLDAEGCPFVTVSDTGPGIPENELDEIMTSFGQGSLAQQTAEDGAGLGLPIVRGLLALHEGRLDFRSKLREGTTATISFPAKRVMRAFPPSPEKNRERKTATAA